MVTLTEHVKPVGIGQSTGIPLSMTPDRKLRKVPWHPIERPIPHRMTSDRKLRKVIWHPIERPIGCPTVHGIPWDSARFHDIPRELCTCHV